MHELYAMHVCMMHVLCNKQQVSVNLQVRCNIHPSNLIPPTHVFNGQFLFLGFLVWALISTGDIKNRRTCQSLKTVKHRNSISRYKSLAQSLLAQDECSPNRLLKYGHGLLQMEIPHGNIHKQLGKSQGKLLSHYISWVRQKRLRFSQQDALFQDLSYRPRSEGPDILCKLKRKLPPFRTWVTDSGQMSPVISLGSS